jgi:DNA helicase-2/ATP-dependent DNA helicase PcrA
MEERVDRLLPYGYVELQISTFHAFCEKLLREYGAEIGLSRDFKLLTELDGWLLARRHLERFALDYYRPLGNPTKYLRGLLTHFSRAKDAAITPDEYVAFVEGRVTDSDGEDDKPRLTELANAYHTYQQILLENDALDFGDLMMYALKLFRERPRVLEELRQRFTYVLVDEFQDTNHAQYEIVKLIAAPRNNLTVVGDDDQSIYKFRGASLENILRFGKDYPEATRMVLTQNYRSVQPILDQAHRFIQMNNPNRLEATSGLDKRLVSSRQDDGLVAHLHLPTLDEETEAVATKILEIKDSHPDAGWNDFVILTRSNDAAVPFLSALERHRIPYQFMALHGLYTKPVVLDLLAYLRALATPHDSPSFYRLLTHPMFGLPPLAIAELSQFANRKGKSLYQACAMAGTLQGLGNETIVEVQDILSKLDSFRSRIAASKVSELFVAVAREVGFVDYINSLPERNKVESFRYLQQFYERLKGFESSHDHPVLKNFLDEFQHERDAGEEGSLQYDPDAGPEMVRIMTVHASKGLEFRYVFIVSMVDQRFPTIARSDAIPLDEGLMCQRGLKGGEVDWHLEEERRLFYVAMTRAKEHVYFSSADDYGGARKRKLSRFLVELGFEKPPGHTSAGSDPFSDLPAISNIQFPISTVIHLPKQFSFTQLSAFRTCPLQYKFAHVLKIPVFGKPTFSFGKTMHNTLHRFFQLWLERTSSQQASLFAAQSSISNIHYPSLDDLLRLYDECWQDDWFKDDRQREQYRSRGQDQLRAFYRFLAEHPPRPKLLEQDFTLKIGEAVIKGRIDRIDETDGGVEIIDYKTGTPKQDGKLEAADREQLLLYQLAARDILQLNPVKLTYHYLEDNSRVSFLGEPDDLLDLQEKIIERVAAIRQSNFTAIPGFHCKFCDFADICEFRQT